MKFYNYIRENILVPRNLEGRREKLRQINIQLLSQEMIEGDLEIDETFEGIPLEMVKVKEIRGNVWLKLRKGYIPSWLKDVKIYGNFKCTYNKLTSLEGCPYYVGGDFLCDYNKLESLEGCPKYVGEYFLCDNNKLESLEGCPKHIEGYFVCSNNNLTSLENCPEYIGGKFDCSNNELTSLEGCPKYIGGDLKCKKNSKKLELPEGIELKGLFIN